ncbi:MAG: DUF268 domain-containing protein [SAR324 cluster bacterium]|uniref:DUF268 domain-containing protein n=1 Tax=SAR324 cluster bacterium TaxID=2024889 RepID=A0A7X9IKT5_9DELT|nr:DUF268 domain-containing protein [SAR324 cluster bacterium]
MIPEELLNRYSMDGTVQIHEGYISKGSKRTHYKYSYEMVENFIALARNKNRDGKSAVDGWSYDRSKSSNYYPETDRWLFEALQKYPIDQKEILIIGSEDPYYEGIAINAGARVTMVEYKVVVSEHPKLATITVNDFEKDVKLFDGAISISSVEHSGLGRYGDPLDPDGDLDAMRTLCAKLKEGSLCYLAVPIGVDEILWNAHRVYGRKRFPLLIEGFEIIESFGFQESDFEVDEHVKRLKGGHPHRLGVSGGAHQPLFVLRKSRPDVC